MRELVEALCSERCAGRAPGTPEGAAAREVVRAALRRAGLEPLEQAVPGARGANLVATLPGALDRFVLLGAHYDHLGRHGAEVFWGADDNAAAVAILVEVARALVRAPPGGRGVIFAAFDAEEPPHFLRESMGSELFAREPPVPLERIDLMICLDLVGHALGGDGVPAEVRDTIMALGAEKSEGTAAHVDRLARAVPGLVVRRADLDAIPPLSDYHAFRRRGVPVLFLSSGQWRHYHTPTDTPDRLDYAKMAATARWLERFIRETCARPEPRLRFLADARDDASGLRSVIEICRVLEPLVDEAALARAAAEALLLACDARGALPEGRRGEVELLLRTIEARLA